MRIVKERDKRHVRRINGCKHELREIKPFYLDQDGKKRPCMIVSCRSCTYTAVFNQNFPPRELHKGWEYWDLLKRYPGIYLEKGRHLIAF